MDGTWLGTVGRPAMVNTTTIVTATTTTQAYVVAIGKLGMTAVAIAVCIGSRIIYRGV